MSTPEWTILEKLLLSQAVYKYGEDNWFQIARNLKHHALLDRPSDYFNQKSCSLQYYLMVENLDKDKQNPLTQDMPPVVQIARELYTLRLEELKKAISEDEEKFLQLVTEIDEIRAGKWDDQLLGLPKEQTTSSNITTPSTDAEKTSQVSTENVQTLPPQITQPETSEEQSTVKEEIIAKVNMDNLEDELRMEQDTIQSNEHKSELSKSSSEESFQSAQNDPARIEESQLDETVKPQPSENNKDDIESKENEDESADQTPEKQIVKKPEETDTQLNDAQEDTTQKQVEIPLIEPPATQHEEEGENKSSEAQPSDITEETVPTNIETTAPVEAENMDISRSYKRHIDDSEDVKDHDAKRQRTERSFQRRGSDTELQRTHDTEDVPIHDEDGQVPEEQHMAVEHRHNETRKEDDDLLTIDTTRTDYSTDVSQGTTPADTSDFNLREGTESVAGSESNAATPTTERKRSILSRDDQRHKSWQKNINLLWREIANHKNGAMFMNPIKESIAPHYYEIVKRPMDLKTIKNRIRDGLINTTTEFERDVLLMLNNSLMYNKEGTEVYQLAREMLDDAMEQIRIFRTADTDTSASSHTRAASQAAKADRRKSTVTE